MPEVTFSIPSTDSDLPGSGEFVSIVGENNVGKSSVLKAIQLALPDTDFTKPRLDHFPNRDGSNGPIEVELTFGNLTAEDKKRQGVRTHVQDGQFRIKKVWDSPNVQPTYYAFRPDYKFPDWFSSKRKRHTFIDAGGEEAEEIIEQYEEQNGEIDSFRKENRSKLRAIAIENNASFVNEGPVSWSKNPGGFKANVDSILPQVIMIPAIKDPSEETDPSRKSTSVGNIINRIFKDHLIEHKTIKKFLETSEEVESLFTGDDKDEAIENLEERITGKVQRMIDIQATINYNPPDVTTGLASNTDLEVVHEGVQTKPEHQGHGAQRALILSLLECLAEDRTEADTEGASRQSLLLLFEEPEIYMHPQMLRRMRDVLLEIARSETAQVICTTHSPVFLDLADRHDGILKLQKEEDSLNHLQRSNELFSEDTAKEARKRLRMILDFDPTANEVFFARRICLVEGDTERAVIEAIARRLADDGVISWQKYLDERRHVTVIGCRGKWNICAFQRVLEGFNIDYFVVHDSDDDGVEEGANGRIRSIQDDHDKILRLDPNLEMSFFNDSWDSDKPWRGTQEILHGKEVPTSAVEFFEFVIGVEVESLTAEPDPMPLPTD